MNKGLSLLSELVNKQVEDTKEVFNLRKNQFSVHVMGYSGSIVVPDIEGLTFLAKSKEYKPHSYGVVRIKISYHGVKINHEAPFLLTEKDNKFFVFMADAGPVVKDHPKKRTDLAVANSIAVKLLHGIFDEFRRTGVRMHLCAAKVPLSSMHYFIAPLN